MKFLARLSGALVALTVVSLALPVDNGDSTAPKLPTAEPETALGLANKVKDGIKTFNLGVPGNKGWYAHDPSITRVSDDELWSYAKAYYEGIGIVQGAQQNDALVAVLFAPGQGMFMGVNPTASEGRNNDRFAEAIMAKAETSAPDLYQILKQREEADAKSSETTETTETSGRASKPSRRKPLKIIHAEDYVYIMAKEIMGGAGATLAPGTKGAVWGSVYGMGDLGPQNCCRENTAKVDPSCTKVQAMLGINYLKKEKYFEKNPDAKPKRFKTTASSSHPQKLTGPAAAARERHQQKANAQGSKSGLKKSGGGQGSKPKPKSKPKSKSNTKPAA